jgi:hypothetical protein
MIRIITLCIPSSSSSSPAMIGIGYPHSSPSVFYPSNMSWLIPIDRYEIVFWTTLGHNFKIESSSCQSTYTGDNNLVNVKSPCNDIIMLPTNSRKQYHNVPTKICRNFNKL